MTLKDDLIAIGLPCIDAEPGVTPHFSRLLTLAEEDLRDSVMNKPILRERQALSEAMLAGHFKSATPQEAVDYVQQQITNGTSEAQVLAAFDNATTVAALKPIMRNMLIGMYRTVDILKLMARILIAIRNKLWSDLPEA
jgi:hypothetical protein